MQNQKTNDELVEKSWDCGRKLEFPVNGDGGDELAFYVEGTSHYTKAERKSCVGKWSAFECPTRKVRKLGEEWLRRKARPTCSFRASGDAPFQVKTTNFE